MAVDPDLSPKLSWKDMLLGGEASPSVSDRNGSSEGRENDFELLEGDVSTAMVDGMPTIAFSERIKIILFKEMDLTIVLKLLGHNIGYNSLLNRILSLWKPAKSFHLKFQDIGDYNKVLTQGPWIIYGQYLTVQPWTREFNPLQPYPSVVLAYIRLPGLPRYLYNRKIIEAIGGLIGKVVKLDFQTDNRTRGRFARLAVFINLDKPLISQVMVDNTVQKLEYEALLTVCFSCGKYGHVKEFCPMVVVDQTRGQSANVVVEAQGDVGGRTDGDQRPEFGQWMLVERKARRGQHVHQASGAEKSGNDSFGSRFSVLNQVGDLGSDLKVANGDFSREKVRERGCR
ncbi:uncharacterized protein [Gossypium hirsutum]|uniref:CCHC-type domain-containing protein n=1 Tax=Gossypium hirsutum TaxID=3635 RepID=A0ABM3A753_GOSHI|nr:uncharacterized protein LOC107904112 [Gossypium hirsutum]XP_040950684.1 uncharacterized protein LOC107904112 [Gossypium hirsutum]XP_040950685.1 uncharacterized protein LOC107904112 [Gossypium hirsutum]XP_040950686.1 uncharacterized protein LOC107904112 [Gossypium hirsutum]XP_040950687.1 uncharacterized protein LOC107904112 [Gossypium hirsutum]XP_040950688.1 uncharacterized protein LOC107904112 [Gossypium hirsutum]XP_040950689.1 uncharacterized protein LOC107904112 [Gossypium hirsutum]XP_0